MGNRVSILGLLISGVLLSACGQSGPLYMPGQAMGAHKKDVFVLDDSKTKPKVAATEDSAKNKAKPVQKDTQEEPSAQSDSESVG